MRIVIDLQAAQAENRKRGIGRYALSLVEGLIKAAGEYEVILMLSDAFPETIMPLRKQFGPLLPAENLRVWTAPRHTAFLHDDTDQQRQAAELVREAFIVSLEPSVVLVLSLFEGLVDDAVTSIGLLDRSIPTVAVLYDLIPLINRSVYLENPKVERWYESKLNHLRRATRVLSISDSSRREALDFLGLPPDSVVNIATAADAGFVPQYLADDVRAPLLERYGLTREFLLYTGGIDHRKNIERLIESYAKLPKAVRNTHQLAIVCSIHEPDRLRLASLAKRVGLAVDELVFTGYVPEADLVALYNVCKAFVFPSWHEGFGLPALEAMSCGKAVIAANTSSLPEVVGRADALFDPYDTDAMTRKIEQVLVDVDFRSDLERHALKQSQVFSWAATATRAWQAIGSLLQEQTKTPLRCDPVRPRLAYFSPLPPERSGISDYSAELIPELSRHYEIDLITDQPAIDGAAVNSICSVRSVDWFVRHAGRYDRILYHFGNSLLHEQMFPLLQRFPGVVVLHDFFLSGVVAHLEAHGLVPGLWVQSLYRSHGYAAVQHRFTAQDTADVVWRYPCNLPVLENALGVIVHSDSSRRMARDWYGASAGADWSIIPLLREPARQGARDQDEIRRSLGFAQDDFIVASFGLLGPTKLNDRLLDAWNRSSLSKDRSCRLVFVGENAANEYGRSVKQKIAQSGNPDNIKIVGWTDAAVFKSYLSIADVGVQLRTLSRGETSASALDCLNYGIPLIVNANGSMADLPDHCTMKLADDFTDEALTEALERLWQDAGLRQSLATGGQQTVHQDHAPRECADRYWQSIERYYECGNAVGKLAARLAQSDITSANLRIDIARSFDYSYRSPYHQRQLLVDISELVQRDVGSGIQRVVRGILGEWMRNPPAGIRIEPVYATIGKPGYRYARRFTLKFLGCPDAGLQDDPVSAKAGDVFFGLDLQPIVVREQENYYQALHRAGVRLSFLVHDLLPITMPECFLPGAPEIFQQWLKVIGQFDGLVCVSAATAAAVREMMPTLGFAEDSLPKLAVSHNGGDIVNSKPTTGLPPDALPRLAAIKAATSFLMVGTLEPRKAHAQVLDAVEQLWRDGQECILVIVGKSGWMVDELVNRLTTHPELNLRLFWFNSISDEYLEQLYSSCNALIAASLDEGFGLPLIEAAQHGLPVIARDIPVFREVAGEHAFYFKADTASELATALMEWNRLRRDNSQPMSRDMPWLSWKESAENLLKTLIEA
ncbi:glycosyl transferase family 1 [Pseudomonas oryzihabitans]|nr:glycosyl transferase family 1 [Pseudomonas psychrotolerans]KTT26979.1 glycosyl transferase family 1 [Pseudomonas psychrotolerans]KTT58385.1 glycosyl transferase family 1 [Pseudomonas psychrotolerans]